MQKLEFLSLLRKPGSSKAMDMKLGGCMEKSPIMRVVRLGHCPMAGMFIVNIGIAFVHTLMQKSHVSAQLLS